MTNYYEELNLNKEASIEEIKKELSRLESVWKRREITNPEKATKKLALIIDARKVFSSEVARREYDADLAKSKERPVEKDPSEELKKWKEQAQAYYSSKQYDLAKAAIEKAFLFSNVNKDDDTLFALAANIYKYNGDFDTAMNYINKAIVEAPDISEYYLYKGFIFIMNRNNESARQMYVLADEKAKSKGNLADRAKACGLLASSYYFYYPMDKKLGEDYANRAVQFGGDPWGNADKVFAAIEKDNERIYNEAVRMSIYNEIDTIKYAINKFNSIAGYKDSEQQIKRLQLKIPEIEDKIKKEKEERERKIKKEKEERERKIKKEKEERERIEKKKKEMKNICAILTITLIVLWIITTVLAVTNQDTEMLKSSFIMFGLSFVAIFVTVYIYNR